MLRVLIFNRRFNVIKCYQMTEKWNCMSTLFIIIFWKEYNELLSTSLFICYLNLSFIWIQSILAKFTKRIYSHNFMENINGTVNPRTHTISIQGMSYGMTIENNLSAMWFKIPKINSNKFNNRLILLIVRLIIKRS